MRNKICYAALIAAVAFCSGIADAQTAYYGQHISALAKENLAKPRPKAPFDLTGTWNMVISPANDFHRFGQIPKLKPAAQSEYDRFNEYEPKGFAYRDDPGACWPLGMPRIMTRFWPIEIIQLPTMIQLTAMFNNSVRWIYMDGRPHPSAEDLVETYNGHSTGRWEGKTLVIDTVGMTDEHHWIQEGVLTGNKLHIVERIRVVDNGNAFEDQFTLTDPDNWEGEWVHTKRFTRDDKADIEEHGCIYEQVSKLPSFKMNMRK